MGWLVHVTKPKPKPRGLPAGFRAADRQPISRPVRRAPVRRPVAGPPTPSRTQLAKNRAATKVRQQRDAARRVGPPTPSRTQLARNRAATANRQRSEAQIRAAVRTIAGSHLQKQKGHGVGLSTLLAAGNPVSLGVHAIGAATGTSRYVTVPERAISNTIRATVERPDLVIPKTAEGFGRLAVGAAAAIPELAIRTAVGAAHGHPEWAFVDLAKATAKDVANRYGPLTKGSAGEAEFRRRLKKEGAASEVVDFFTAALPAGGAAGRVAGRVARSGRLGEKARVYASAPRPRLRVSGNKTVPQELSPNLMTVAAQRRRDVKLQAAYEKRKAEAIEQGTSIRGVQPKPGEVVRRPSRVAGEPTKQAAAQRQSVSKAQSRTFQRQSQGITEQIHAGFDKTYYAGLNKAQRVALFHVVQGMVDPTDAGRAVAQLKRRRARIIENSPKTNNELRVYKNAHRNEISAIDYLIRNADKVFGGKSGQQLSDLRRVEAKRAVAIERDLPGLRNVTAEARRLHPQARELGIVREYDHMRHQIEEARASKDITKDEAQIALDELEKHKAELDTKFVRQVRKTRQVENLGEPAYFRHRRPTRAGAAAYTPGTGAHAPGQFHRSEMKLLDTGMADVSPASYRVGLAQGIKRKHALNLAAEHLDTHAVPISQRDLEEANIGKGTGPNNLSIHDLQKVMDSKRMDERDWAFYKPGIRRADNAPEDTGDLSISAVDAKGAADEIVRSEGWRLIPKAVYDELHPPHSTGKSRTLGRLADKAQGFQSREVLGLNPSWLQAQVIGNTIQASFGVAGRPHHFVTAPLWWRKFQKERPEQAKEVMASFSVGSGKGHGRRVSLGRASDNDLLNGLRGFSETRFGQTLSRHTLPELLFKLDEAQNGYFRKTVLYSSAKRQTTQNMGRALAGASEEQARVIQHVMSLPPKDRVAELLQHPEFAEKHAQFVNDALGDFTSYTQFERKALKRFVMFYGFMRFSLRTVFYTLPVKHPIVASIVAKLAQLHNEEIKDLLGGDSAPWAYSRIYFKKGDKLAFIDLARENPLTNPIVQGAQEGLKSLGQFFSPLAQAAVDQAYGQSLFTNKPLTVNGQTTKANLGGLLDPKRFQLLLAAGMRATYPGRLVMDQRTHGATLSDDSLPFLEHPVRYKTSAAILKEQQRRDRRGSDWQALLRGLTPVLSRPDNARDIVQSRQKNTPGGKPGQWTLDYGTPSTNGQWTLDYGKR